MTPEQMEKRVKKLLSKFDDINTFYIEKVADQIATIGELSTSSMQIIAVWASMYENINDINKQIAKAVNVTIPELKKLYADALNDVYYDDRFARALNETPLSEESKETLERYTESVYRQTQETLTNLSNTTAVSETYREAVDKAVLTVSSGLGDYNSQIRSVLREVGSSGLQVEYESGFRRRLDSALRQNIVDGVKQIQQHASDMIGEDLGYDAKEISVHANSAPDHEPVQGHVFLNEEFEKLQTEQDCVDVEGRHFPAMRRPIAEWNCMHFAFSFSTKYSRPMYTTEQLDDFIDKNADGCDIDGKHYTLYEARQLMRQIETDIRRQKDIAVAAKAAGDMDLRRECQGKINRLTSKYNKVVEASGLDAHRDRMVVQGFRAVKVS